MKVIKNQHILISRVDAIGDVVLTLPMCGYLKSIYPAVTISFLGKTYTGPVINTCGAVDHFINYDELKVLPQKNRKTFYDQNISISLFMFIRKNKLHC